MSHRFARAAYRAGLSLSRSLLSALAFPLLASPAFAATLNWTGATDVNWSTAGNWNPAQTPATGDDLVFVGGIGNDPTNNDLVAVTLHSITLSNFTGATTISGNAIALQSGGSITDTSAGVNVNCNLTLNGPVVLFGPTRYVGVISGTGPVTADASNMFFQNANTYSGATTVNAPVPGGRLVLGVSGAIPAASAVTVTAGGLLLFGTGSQTIGSLAGGGTVNLQTFTLTVGGDNSSTTFSGDIQGTGSSSLTKVGSGTFTLAGPNTYTGSTSVNAGRLDVTGSINTQVPVNAGTLGGSGTINGAVGVFSGTTLRPGVAAGTGILNTGPVTLVAGSTLQLEINGTTAGTQYDQVNVTGTVNVTGATLSVTAAAIPVGSVITIINNDGADAVTGTFNGFTQGSILTSGGSKFIVSYVGGDGNDVTLTSVAAPTAPTIGAATPGNGQATISFTPGAANGSPITSYTVTCNPGAFTGSGAASPITVTGLTNGVSYTCSVTATNLAGTGPASGTVGVTPLASVSTTCASATGSGPITVTFTGGGAGCSFTSTQCIGAPPGAPPVPPTLPLPKITFPHGMFDFTTAGCTAGSTLNFTITYPAPLPGNTQYWKYGPTAADPTNHWYVLPATITGNTVTFSITDGGLGDDDLNATNGTITDQGGPGAGNAEIPTLQQWALILLALLMLSSGAWAAKRRRTM